MLDVSHLGVDLDDQVIAVNGWPEHPILRARILLGHAVKFTPCQRSHPKEPASITPSSGAFRGRDQNGDAIPTGIRRAG